VLPHISQERCSRGAWRTLTAARRRRGAREPAVDALHRPSALSTRAHASLPCAPHMTRPRHQLSVLTTTLLRCGCARALQVTGPGTIAPAELAVPTPPARASDLFALVVGGGGPLYNFSHPGGASRPSRRRCGARRWRGGRPPAAATAASVARHAQRTAAWRAAAARGDGSASRRGRRKAASDGPDRGPRAGGCRRPRRPRGVVWAVAPWPGGSGRRPLQRAPVGKRARGAGTVLRAGPIRHSGAHGAMVAECIAVAHDIGLYRRPNPPAYLEYYQNAVQRVFLQTITENGWRDRSPSSSTGRAKIEVSQRWRSKSPGLFSYGLQKITRCAPRVLPRSTKSRGPTSYRVHARARRARPRFRALPRGRAELVPGGAAAAHSPAASV